MAPNDPVRIVNWDDLLTGLVLTPLDVNVEQLEAGGLESWRVSTWADVTVDDSDKLCVVPANREWHVLAIYVDFTTVVGGAARQLCVQILDAAGNIIGRYLTGITQAASLHYYYTFAPSMPDLLAVRDSNCQSTNIPPTLVLGAGFGIRVWDNKAIDPTHDDMLVRITYAARTI